MKLGRRDARPLIDVAAAAHQHARPYLPGELTRQIDQVLGQLRMGQVNAENHAPQEGKPEENDLDKAPAYDQRMATVGFRDVARRFPALVGEAIRLGWSASRIDTAATISLNLVSGIAGGYARYATTGVLQALFAGGPTPHRVRAARPSLILVAGATAARSGSRRPPAGRRPAGSRRWTRSSNCGFTS